MRTTILVTAVVLGFSPYFTVLQAEPTPPSDGLSLSYQTSIGSSGLVRVFYGTQLNLYRTTQFRLRNYSLDKDAGIVSLYFETTLSASDVTELNKQLEQKASNPKIDAAIPVGPRKVELILKDASGRELTKKAIGDGGSELSLSDLWVVNMPFLGDEKAFKAAEVAVHPTYKFKSSSESFAKVESLANVIDRVGETVFGGKIGQVPSDKEYITRDSKQAITRAVTNSASVTSLNPTRDQLDRVTGTLNSFIAQLDDVTLDERAIAAMDKLVIWSPGVGRIEISPSTQDFRLTKEQIEQTVSAKLQQQWSIEHTKASSAMDFAEWYSRKYREGHSSGSFSGDAGFGDLVDLDADSSFSSDYKQEDDMSGKYSRERSVYEQLKANSTMSSDQLQQSKSYREGAINSFRADGKAMNLAVWRDTSYMKKRIVDDLQINTGAGAPIDIKYDSLITFYEVIPERPTTFAEKVVALESRLDVVQQSTGRIDQQLQNVDLALQRVNSRTAFIKLDDDGHPYFLSRNGHHLDIFHNGGVSAYNRNGIDNVVIFRGWP